MSSNSTEETQSFYGVSKPDYPRAFSSSKIVALTKNGRSILGFGAPAMTYIEEKIFEEIIGQSLSESAYSRAIAWGNLMEQVCYDALELKWEMVSNKHVAHSHHFLKDYWIGACDIKCTDSIGEIKCYGRKKAVAYALCLQEKSIESLKANFDQEYWQMVSNAILNNVDYAEAISFLPDENDMERVRYLIEETDYLSDRLNDPNPWKYRFINECENWELSTINSKRSQIKNITRFRFKVPKEDKEFLTNRVFDAVWVKAWKLINQKDFLNEDQEKDYKNTMELIKYTAS